MTDRTDTFIRSNGALLGSTPSDSGSAWAGSGTWTISSNLVSKTASFNTNEIAYLETSVADGDASGTLSFISGASGICGRVSDTSNFFALVVTSAGLTLYKVVAGTPSTVGSAYSGTISANDVITLSMSGDNLVAKQNGTTRISATDSFNNTATKHGLYDFNMTSIWSLFQFTGGSSPPTVTVDQGSYAITGKTTTLTKQTALSAAYGSYALTGKTVTFAIESPGNTSMSAEYGTYTITGQTAFIDRLMNVAQGSYALSGQEVTFSITQPQAYTFSVDYGTYNLAGKRTTLDWSGAPIVVNRGNYTISIDVKVGL